MATTLLDVTIGLTGPNGLNEIHGPSDSLDPPRLGPPEHTRATGTHREPSTGHSQGSVPILTFRGTHMGMP